MGRNLDKFLLLMWKNWILQYRKPLQTIIEIVVPIVFTMLLVLTRDLIDPKFNDAVVYKNFCPLPPTMNPYGLTLCDPEANNTDHDLPDLPNLLNLTLVYAPNTSVAINKAMVFFQPLFAEVVGRANVEDMNTYYDIFSSDVTAGGLVFEAKSGNLEDLKDLQVQVRLPSELRVDVNSLVDNWYTKLLFPLFQLPGPRGPTMNTGAAPSYYGEGFLALQYFSTIALTLVKENVEPSDTQDWLNNHYPYVNMRRFAYTSWYDDPLLSVLTGMLPLIIMISFVYTSLNTVKAITTEKERQLKESMKIMGLPNWLHWTAWFTKCFIFLAISCALMVVLLKAKWFGDYAVLTYADGTVIYAFLMCYACSTITFCFALSTFFSKANNASTVAGLAWFISYAPYSFIQQQYDTMSLVAKLLISLLQNSGMALGCNVILMYEGTVDGVKWSTLFKPNTSDDNLSLGHIMLMLILDTFLYLFIALYVEGVFPGEYGVPKPWYFPFTKSYWCGKQEIEKNENGNSSTNNPYYQDRDFFEADPTNLHAGVKIRNLRKVFGDKVAVEELTLNMYEDQITVLLGHNGAGKTTTMSMLTGMITPSQGNATINGYDIRENIAGVRQSLGLCPQHNVIFDELTVAEHLYFFSKLKGLEGKEIKAEIDKYVKLLDLEEKKNSKSSTLSGGMKRKLSVGVALCGFSKVVMLDEPTSGMDPSARRTLWNLIEAEKGGRTILLTTHFMDEADLLGDRIAIMSGGQLQCCGSSFFLKKKYGTGYQLIMEKTTNCDVFGVKALLKKYIPDIEINSNVGSELSFLLFEKYSAIFEPMLRDLEANSERLGVRSYGISLTTMEEVFMKVGAAHSREETSNEPTNNNRNNGSSVKINVAASPAYTTGLGLIYNQFYAMFLKRIVSFKRSWFLLLLQIFIPCIFLCIAILSLPSGMETILPAADLTLSKFTNPVTLMQNEKTSDYTDAYEKLVTVKMTENITKTMLDVTKSTPTTARLQYIVGADIVNSTNKRASLTAYFNNDAYHSPGIALSLILNSIFKVQTKCKTCSIDFVNYPLEYTPDSKITKSNSYQPVAFNAGFSMSFVSAFFVLFIVREIVSKSKHLQFVSGLKVSIFWISHLICDLLVFVLVVAVYSITLICFQREGYDTADAIARMILIFFYFSCAALPLVYTLGYLFEIPSSGFTKITLISVFTGCVPFIVVMVFQQIDNLKDAGNTMHWVFLLSPWYSMITGISESYNTFTYNNLCDQYYKSCAQQGLSKEQCLLIMIPRVRDICEDADGNYYRWKSPGIGRNLVFSFTEAVVFFILLLAIERQLFSKIFYFIKQTLFQKYPVANLDEDGDVAEERERIRNNNQDQIQSENIVVIQDLTKYYKKFLAVNGLSLGIKRYECFGLLGENGAGKTSTFKMMTGDEAISYGDGWVNGISIKSRQKEVQKVIGYCPQFDALLDDMTGRETIVMFALIRGIVHEDSVAISEYLANEFDFTAHLHKKVKEMSGGNKRKLSTALSLVGDPPVLYLDEPTTGMDPATKRYLWAALCRLRDSGKSIVLTSHSMEECEALCTRLAIMVHGNFKCLGSTQHLKSKFAQGYSLSIKIKKRRHSSSHQHAETTNVERFISEKFPSAKLTDKHEELLSYHITDSNVPWSRMFGILEEGKKVYLEIEDYYLGQCTLEQVFLSFTQKRD